MSEGLFVHMQVLAALLILWERIHESFQTLAINHAEFLLEGVLQPASQTALPAFTPVVQVSPTAGQLASWIHLDPFLCAHQTDHLPFRQDGATTNAGSLGYMFHTLDRFLRHLDSQNP